MTTTSSLLCSYYKKIDMVSWSKKRQNSQSLIWVMFCGLKKNLCFLVRLVDYVPFGKFWLTFEHYQKIYIQISLAFFSPEKEAKKHAWEK